MTRPKRYKQCVPGGVGGADDSPVSRSAALAWHGKPKPDSLIAATAIVHDLTVVTRNVDDFKKSGVRVLNVFEEA